MQRILIQCSLDHLRFFLILKRIESFIYVNPLHAIKRSNIMMMIIPKRSFASAAVAAVLFFSTIGMSYQQPPFFDFENVLDCITYEAAEKTISIDCDHASFGDLVSTITDESVLVKLEQDGEYL